MFGVATTHGRYDGPATKRLSTWTKDYLFKAALADLGCAMVGVFVAAQVGFGSKITATHLAFSLALLGLWLAAVWLTGGCDARLIGMGLLQEVAGRRTTVRSTAGLTLLHVDHPQLTGIRLLMKDLFDRCVAAVALIVLAPLMAILAVSVRLSYRGSALFIRVRVDKNGRMFTIHKRPLVPPALLRSVTPALLRSVAPEPGIIAYHTNHLSHT